MASIDLPRALQDYFAFAETTPTRNGRRFSITFPYVKPDGRLDRLQWWYHLSSAKELALGDGALERLRGEAIERFHVHIERWLHNTAQVLYGEGAIPQLGIAGEPRVTCPAATAPVTAATPTDAGEELAADAVAPQEPARQPAGKAAFG
jgi:hypothetical protein